MHRLTALLISLTLAGVALTGCSSGQTRGDADLPPQSGAPSAASNTATGEHAGTPTVAPGSPMPAPGPTPTATSTPAAAAKATSGEPAPPPTEPKELVSRAPAEMLEHVTLAPGTPIDQTGIFFVNVETGIIDGWTIRREGRTAHNYAASPDNRWILSTDGFLVDRTTEALYQWNNRQGRLVAAGGAHLLFEVGDRFWLTTADPSEARPLEVAPAPSGSAQARISPDGNCLFLVNGPDIWLVATESGEAMRVGEIPARQGALALTSLNLPDRPADVTVIATYASGQSPFKVTESHVLRFAWTGERLAGTVVPSATVLLSPDGSHLAWEEWLDGLWMVVVASDDKPLLRLDGASLGSGWLDCGWLADGSGLVVYISRGFEILRTDGTLLAPPAFADAHWRLGEPVPAPDRADLFAIGSELVRTRDGSQVAAAPTANMLGTQRLEPWGYTSSELRLALHDWGGKDAYPESYILPPRVERPPFDPSPALMVSLPDGDCLNLREGRDTRTPVITCLPPGTRLHRAVPPGRYDKGWNEWNPVYSWLYVKTDAGQRGWVSFSAEYLAWAPVQPAAAPAPESAASDQLLSRIEDENANMAWWLSVALGEADCGPLCSGNSFDAVIRDLIDREKKLGGLAETLRRMPAFDAARHEAALKPLEAASQLLVRTHAQLGAPGRQPSAEWRQVVTEARDLLTGE